MPNVSKKKPAKTPSTRAAKPAAGKKPPAKKPAAKKAPAKKPAATKAPAAKQPAAARKPAAKPRAPREALTVDARRKLLKPRSDYDDLVAQVAIHWEQDPGLRVPGLTPARLRKLARDAERAVLRETALRAKLERQIAAVYDARLLAEDAVWRAVLDVNAAVKLFARSDENLPERFAFLTAALGSTREPSEPTPPAPAPEPPKPAPVA
jgi:hypothetical protein